jgi:hypothetical protein
MKKIEIEITEYESFMNMVVDHLNYYNTDLEFKPKHFVIKVPMDFFQDIRREVIEDGGTPCKENSFTAKDRKERIDYHCSRFEFPTGTIVDLSTKILSNK